MCWYEQRTSAQVKGGPVRENYGRDVVIWDSGGGRDLGDQIDALTHHALEHGELVAQSKDLQLQSSAAMESRSRNR